MLNAGQSMPGLDKGEEELAGALGARGLTAADWARIDDHHLGALSADLAAGRTGRQAIYEAKCDEEMARRAALSEPVSPTVPNAPPYVPAPAALVRTLPSSAEAAPTAGQPEPVAGVVWFPALTLEQYVSLHGDLGARTAERATTLSRYGVPNETSFRALDQHWQARVVKSPELRSRLLAATVKYTSWLATQTGYRRQSPPSPLDCAR